jgi:hypothetical protein
MMGVVFEPETLPELRGIAAAINLDGVRYDKNPDSLVDLARRFKDEGFREQERNVVYARRRAETGSFLERCGRSRGEVSACADYILREVLFDLTCQYGLSPVRPLKIVFVLWLTCSFVYFMIVHFEGKSALYRLDKPDLPDASTIQTQRVRPQWKQQCHWRWRSIEFLSREFRVLRTAMFFSAMCALSLSLRDVNFGPWIRLLTRHEFDIRAVGWARVVAGYQSITSVCLIALSIITYFVPLFW